MKWISLFLIPFLFAACNKAEFVTGTNGDVGEFKPGPPIEDGLENPELLDEYSCGASAKKVQICHFPPGNSAARHTICIGRPAYSAHVGHHIAHDGGGEDYLGPCGPDGAPTPNPVAPSPTPDPGDGDGNDDDDDDDDNEPD